MALEQAKCWGSRGSGPTSFVSFPQETSIPSTLTPHPCALPLPQAHHWPIALSVFIDLGKTGVGPEGHDKQDHPVSGAQNGVQEDSPWKHPRLLEVLWRQQGRGASVDLPH